MRNAPTTNPRPFNCKFPRGTASDNLASQREIILPCLTVLEIMFAEAVATAQLVLIPSRCRLD